MQFNGKKNFRTTLIPSEPIFCVRLALFMATNISSEHIRKDIKNEEILKLIHLYFVCFCIYVNGVSSHCQLSCPLYRWVPRISKLTLYAILLLWKCLCSVDVSRSTLSRMVLYRKGEHYILRRKFVHKLINLKSWLWR